MKRTGYMDIEDLRSQISNSKGTQKSATAGSHYHPMMGAQGFCAVISWRLEDLEEAGSQFKGNSSHSETCCRLDMQPEAGENIPLSLFRWRRNTLPPPVFLGFPCGSAGKESPCNVGDLGLIPGLERSPREGKGYPLQYSGLENSLDCIVHGIAKSQTRLHFLFFFFQLSSLLS